VRCKYAANGETRKGHVYYRCHTPDCPITGIREEAVQAVITSSLTALEFTPEEKTYLASRIRELKERWIKDKELTIANLQLRIQQITERLTKLTDAYHHIPLI
jgi:site-specific DNA recombinase